MSSNIYIESKHDINSNKFIKETISTFSNRTFLMDLIVCGSIILASRALNNSLLFYILLLYILFKCIANTAQYSFNIILLLIPNLGVVFLPGVPAPLVNLIMALTVIKMAIQYKGRHKGFLLFTILFIFYEWIHAFAYDLSSTISLVSWTFSILYILLFIDQKVVYKHAVAIKYFIGGSCLSTIYGVYDGFLKHGSIASFSRVSMSDRFSGGAGDANYYSVYILIGLFSMVLLVNKKTGIFSKIVLIIIFIFLAFFGFTSLSRMFILVFGFGMVVYLLRVIISNKKYTRHRKFIIGLIAIAGSGSTLYINAITNNLNLIFSRFTTSDNLSSLTSNRDVIIEHYMNFLTSHPFSMIFGVGIQKYYLRTGFDNNIYAHNFLMELLVGWGVVGSILFFCFIATLFYIEKQKNNSKEAGLIVWIPALCMGIGYMSINGIEVESFYILIIYVIKNIYNKVY